MASLSCWAHAFVDLGLSSEAAGHLGMGIQTCGQLVSGANIKLRGIHNALLTRVRLAQSLQTSDDDGQFAEVVPAND